MSKYDVMVVLGIKLAQELYDECLQYEGEKPLDEDASNAIYLFHEMCECGVEIHKAFVIAFFG